MTTSEGKYRLKEVIYTSQNSIVYRAYNSFNHQSVIIKTLNHDFYNPRTISTLKKEYNLLKKLEGEYVVHTYEVLREESRFSIVMEDFEGVALSEYIKNHSLDLPEVLDIACKIAKSINHIHSNNIIHKDINPSNIIYNQLKKIIKIIDLGISTEFSLENQQLLNPNMLEGTLAYISPEQTGRMNRHIDYRTDFYSFGVTLYELFTGALPFITNDQFEMVHCHIAKLPVPVANIKPSIPKILSDIIMKLLEKNSENRYQSAQGILYDLEFCLKNLNSLDSISLKIAQNDISSKFKITQKLYGRESEIEILNEAFESISKKDSQMVLIKGYSGIGKTALVKELYKPMTAKRGYFISGKFEQFQRNIPYFALANAFSGLIKQLLGEPEITLNTWREELTAALGTTGQVVIDIIPELELIIGPQPAVPILGYSETQNRFNMVFQRFIKVFCSPNHPLVIFLDDLQWVDAATLKFIEWLIGEHQIDCLLLIGAYRDNEVSTTHPLILMIEQLYKKSVPIKNITLKPLTSEHIEQLVAGTLNQNLIDCTDLAKLLKQKTNGNPFFLNELLKSLYSQGYFILDRNNGKWSWDINRLKTINITENVVELLANKILNFSPDLQDILKLVSIIGNTFHPKLLSILSEISEEEIIETLWPAIKDGMIIQIGTNYKFLHDRLQQSAYSLIKENDLKLLHLKTGKLMLLHYNEQQKEDNIFEIAGHLNKSQELITDLSEKYLLINLNLKAGKKALNSIAYTTALNYLNTAISLLPQNCWQTCYDITLNIYTESIVAAFFSGDYKLMEKYVVEVLTNAKSILEKISAYKARTNVCVSENRNLDGIKIMIPVLMELGVSFPENPTMEHIQTGLGIISEKLKNKSLDELLNMPLMTDLHKIAAMEILVNISTSCYQSFPALFPLVVLEQVNISLEYGNCPLSPFGYITYAMILSGLLEDYDSAFKFGKLALTLAQKLDAKMIYGRILFLFNNNIRHHKEHLGNTISDLIESAAITMERGDLEYSSLTKLAYVQHLFYSGESLDKLKYEMTITAEIMFNIKQEVALKFTNIYRQTVINLIDNFENPCSLVGEAFDDTKPIPDNDLTTLYCLYSSKAMLEYLFYNYSEAAKFIGIAESSLPGAIGLAGVPLVYFYDCLIKLAVYKELSAKEKDSIISSISISQAKLKMRAENAPMNHLHKWYLVEAEKYRILGNRADAMDFYDKAILKANENGYINEEALANELAAKFYFGLGKNTIGNSYLIEAHRAYSQWGAKVKAKFLEQNYPFRSHQSSTLRTTHGTFTLSGHGLDLNTVIKASLALSSEIQLDILVQKLLNLVIENAGASSGYLVLPNQDDWYIAAQAKVYSSNASLENIPLNSTLLVCEAIVRYVIHTKKEIVIEDALKDPNFSSNSYIEKNGIHSLVCMPLLVQNRLSGILYLENNLVQGVFVAERTRILRMIAAQGATSIENAQLYMNLEGKVKERTEKLNETLTLLKQQHEQLKSTQSQLVQSEKMAGLGTMVAGVAHEMNNPTNYIYLSSKTLERDLLNFKTEVLGMMSESDNDTIKYFEEYFTKFKRSLVNIVDGSNRIKTIVEDLRTFSRLDEATKKEIIISEALDSTLRIIKTQYTDKIEFVTDYRNICKVECYPAQLNQVFLNIIVNACYAIIKKQNDSENSETGRILITTEDRGQEIILSFEDNGCGMTEEVKTRIFEPFFTTKPIGEGTGLGMSISYGIIKKHNGDIVVETENGKGTTVTVTLPK